MFNKTIDWVAQHLVVLCVVLISFGAGMKIGQKCLPHEDSRELQERAVAILEDGYYSTVLDRPAVYTQLLRRVAAAGKVSPSATTAWIELNFGAADLDDLADPAFPAFHDGVGVVPDVRKSPVSVPTKRHDAEQGRVAP